MVNPDFKVPKGLGLNKHGQMSGFWLDIQEQINLRGVSL